MTLSTNDDGEGPVHAIWLGTRPYGVVDALQRALFDARRAELVDDTVLFTEFEPVITLGRGAKPAHLLTAPSDLDALGVAIERVDRGGDVTLHAPGQLVCYPIVLLPAARRDVRRYVQDLTEVMRRVVAHEGIDAGPFQGLIGLWANSAAPGRWAPPLGASHEPMPSEKFAPAKLGAIGVRLSRWVTLHGFALNLTTAFGLYAHIVPCGIANYPVASVQSLTGRALGVRIAAEHAALAFSECWKIPVLQPLDAGHVTDAQLIGYCLEHAVPRCPSAAPAGLAGLASGC